MVLWGTWLACVGGEPLPVDPCSAEAEPELVIGYGVGGYAPIDDGGGFPLVHGPQGGFHLEIGLLARGIDAENLVVGHLEGTIGGELLAEADPWFEFTCDPELGGLVSYGTRLVYDSTPDWLDGKVTDVTVELNDPDGGLLDAASTFVIVDDP
jgi:hypothetical protein